jgi:hypothetical protein
MNPRSIKARRRREAGDLALDETAEGGRPPIFSRRSILLDIVHPTWARVTPGSNRCPWLFSLFRAGRRGAYRAIACAFQ